MYEEQFVDQVEWYEHLYPEVDQEDIDQKKRIALFGTQDPDDPDGCEE